MSILNHIILVLLWSAFGVLHSLLADTGVKEKMQVWLSARYKYYQFGYSVVAAVTLTGVLVFQFNIQSLLLFTLPVWAKWMVVLPVLTGATIMAIVIRKYFFSLSGIRAFFKKKPPVVLEQRGLNRYVRHPLYAGTLLFVWSLFLLMPLLNHLLACVIITVYILAGARLEEKKLVAQFGEQYIMYKQKVPMIVPKMASSKL